MICRSRRERSSWALGRMESFPSPCERTVGEAVCFAGVLEKQHHAMKVAGGEEGVKRGRSNKDEQGLTRTNTDTRDSEDEDSSLLSLLSFGSFQWRIRSRSSSG